MRTLLALLPLMLLLSMGGTAGAKEKAPVQILDVKQVSHQGILAVVRYNFDSPLIPRDLRTHSGTTSVEELFLCPSQRQCDWDISSERWHCKIPLEHSWGALVTKQACQKHTRWAGPLGWLALTRKYHLWPEKRLLSDEQVGYFRILGKGGGPFTQQVTCGDTPMLDDDLMSPGTVGYKATEILCSDYFLRKYHPRHGYITFDEYDKEP